MIGLRHCPHCNSARVQRGYNDPPLLLRMFGIHELLCNNCGSEFKGFAVPGTVKRSRKIKIELGGAAASRRRRAQRLQVRLPVKLMVYGSEERYGGHTVVPIISGYTRDLSEIGLASVFPMARFDDRDLTAEHRRLRFTIRLPPSADVQIYATVVRYELLDSDGNDQGWLIGARITKMSAADRQRLQRYLSARRW